MRPVTRRGFTLVELMLSLVMLGIFAGSLVTVVRGAGRTAARATARLLADRAVLSLQFFVRQELRDAAVSDLAVVTPARLALSRPIGEAIACLDSGGVVLLPDASWDGTRAPEGARDDVLLLVDARAATWLRLPIDSVARDRCPLDHAPAFRVRVAVHPGRSVLAQVLEPVELSAYRSGAADWFGLTPADHSSSVQPFAGPLTPGVAGFVVTASRLDVTVPPLSAATVAVQAPLRAQP